MNIQFLTILYYYKQSIKEIAHFKNLQRGFVKLGKHTLIGYLTLSILIVSTGLIYLFNPFTTKSAEAAWPLARRANGPEGLMKIGGLS